MNKNLDNPKPEQDLRIYSYIGLALVTIYGAAYYLFPDTLPRGLSYAEETVQLNLVN